MAAYYRPHTLDDALGFLAETPATVTAGCTDLFPATRRRALEGPILDITGISALRGITKAPDHIRIGANTRWSDIIRADLQPAFDMLKQAAVEVGSVQIQNAGTLAGNICNASPAADGVPCLLALNAIVEIASAKGARTLPLTDFITGVRQTALAPDEIVTALLVPTPDGQSRFLKLGARKYLVISIAMVAARLVTDSGHVTSAAVAVGACSAVATRLPTLEKALTGRRIDASLTTCATGALIAEDLSPIDDIRADAAYRTHAATQLIRRALNDLAAQTTGAAA